MFFRKPGRRARGVAGAPAHLTVESCELVTQGGFTLARLSGTGTAGTLRLVLDAAPAASFDPLPDPAGVATPDGWRAAFALPAEHAGAPFHLELEDGRRLKVPRQRPASDPAPLAPVSADEADVDVLHAALERAVARAEQFERRWELSERQLAATRERLPPTAPAKLVAAWSESAELRELLDDRTAAAHSAERELPELREEVAALGARIESAVEEKVAAQRALADALAAQLALRAQLADSQKRSAPEPTPAPVPSGPPNGNRRRLLGRRRDDSGAAALRARIKELEAERDAFSVRATSAVEKSLREERANLEEEVDNQRQEMDELRSRLESENKRFARDSSPPWSAIDDELLARVQRAEALAGP